MIVNELINLSKIHSAAYCLNVSIITVGVVASAYLDFKFNLLPLTSKAFLAN